MQKNTYRDDVTPAPKAEDIKTVNDPKYCFLDGRIFSANGGYWISADEPVIVFRGKDQAAISAIVGYLECLNKQIKTEHVKEHIKTATERLETFLDFQTSRPDFVGIGCGIDEKLKAA